MRLLLILMFCLPQLAFAQIKVVTSIKPLTLILQEIGGDKIQIEQLIPDQASHHDYPLKMSDHRRLHQADLIVWIGADLESFLARPLDNLDKEKTLPLIDLPDILWPSNSEEEHGHHIRDPHLWLNPQNVMVIVKSVTKKLVELDQAHASEFQRNAEQFIFSIEKLDQEIEKQMLPLSHKGFAVYHHGYSHFVNRFQLTQLGYLTLTPERKSGARNLNQLLNKLQKEGKCIFAEPFVDDAQVKAIANKHQLRLGYLDLMGVKSDNYQQLMRAMSDSFLTCLSDGGR
ncbi:MAG: zinc ABC transporter substrate-binding protein [Cellvibrio sp.]|jgi:zinc transport system substrate-binding protein|nr:zinc ABC transporter substrate-binding protein [Cellvibrio sp.]